MTKSPLGSMKEFDNELAEIQAKRHCWPHDSLATAFESGFYEGKQVQFCEDKATIEKLASAVEVMREALENCTRGDLSSGDGIYKADVARDALNQVEKILEGKE